MTTRLAHARQRVAETEKLLAEQRADMRRLALDEIRRGVSATRVAAELGMSRTAVGNWAREAGLSGERREYAEPLEVGE